MKIGNNIRYLRKHAGMGQDDLAEILGYKSFTTIQKWESGVSTPPLDTFIRMADLFKVDIDDFAREDLSASDYKHQDMIKSISVPVYGRIPAGVPLEAIEDITEYVALSEDLKDSDKEYFSLRITGNSMYPKYEDGDIVIFERVNVCENGSDCAVRVSGKDATFKKVRIIDHGIILQPINPEYDPIQVDSSSDDGPVEILGIAREIRRDV